MCVKAPFQEILVLQIVAKVVPASLFPESVPADF